MNVFANDLLPNIVAPVFTSTKFMYLFFFLVFVLFFVVLITSLTHLVKLRNFGINFFKIYIGSIQRQEEEKKIATAFDNMIPKNVIVSVSISVCVSVNLFTTTASDVLIRSGE